MRFIFSFFIFQTINDDIKNKNHEILYIEQKCINQNIARVSDIQQNEIVSNKHNTDVGNKAFNNKQVNTLYFRFNYCKI